MATIDDRATATRPKQYTGADVLVESLVRHGVEVIFAYPGGASMPMHQALTRYPRPDPHDPAAARAGRDLRRRGLRPRQRQARRGHGHLRPGSPEPGHRPGRRQDGLPADRRDHRPGAHPRHRHRRVPGNADGRGLPGDHQAPLPGAERPRHRPDRQGSVPHRQHRPARPGPDRRAQGRPEHASSPTPITTWRWTCPAIGCRRRPSTAKIHEVLAALKATQEADHLLRRRRHRLERRGASSASSPPRRASPSP